MITSGGDNYEDILIKKRNYVKDLIFLRESAHAGRANSPELISLAKECCASASDYVAYANRILGPLKSNTESKLFICINEHAVQARLLLKESQTASKAISDSIITSIPKSPKVDHKKTTVLPKNKIISHVYDPKCEHHSSTMLAYFTIANAPDCSFSASMLY